MPDENPFLRYRERLDSWAAARAGGMDDEQFVQLVTRLDDAVAAVDGRGFRITPVVDGRELAAAAGLEVALSIKVEVDNVGGSHKARHLMGVAIHLLVAEALGDEPLDFFVLSSSISTVLGGLGLADYAGANAFLDAFAHSRADSLSDQSVDSRSPGGMRGS